MYMNRKLTAIVLSLAISSTSFAQVAQNYCGTIAQNEAQQIQILTKVKEDIKKSSKLRAASDGVFAVSGALMTAGSVADLVQDFSVMNVISTLIHAGYTYLNIKSAADELSNGKERNLTLDEMIAKRQAILTAVASQSACSPQLMASTLADLLVERIAIQKAGISSLAKLIEAVEDQKSTVSASIMTGIGAVGLLYTLAKFKTQYFVVTFLVGGISLAMTAGGSYTLAVDYFTLRPVINDLKDAKAQTESQLAQDVEQLKKLGRANLN
jgi:hypothetical protein